MNSKRTTVSFRFDLSMVSILGLLLAFMVIAIQDVNAETWEPIEGITWAENSLQASTGRIYVTATGGVYEIINENNQWVESEIMNPNGINCNDDARPCVTYRGITEMNGYIYIIGRTVPEKDAQPTDIHLFALPTDAPQGTDLIEIDDPRLDEIIEPNGMTADPGTGTLYIADMNISGLPVPGFIFKVEIPMTDGHPEIDSVTKIYDFDKGHTNGMKFHNGRLYVSLMANLYFGANRLVSFSVQPDGLGEETEIFSKFVPFDDFILVEGGFVIADWMSRRLLYLDENGNIIDTITYNSPKPFPSSLTVLTGYDMLLVTDTSRVLPKTGEGRIYFEPNIWGIVPR